MNIELLLRSRLTKDLLSPLLVKAGFTVFCEPTHSNSETIVVIDYEDHKDLDRANAHKLGNSKIVALTSNAGNLEIELNEVKSLSGILTHDLSADALVRSLLLICSGERIFPKDLVLVQKPASPSFEHHSDGARLSPREKEILVHLVAGHPNKLIARHMGITEATVKVHLKSVQRKIGVQNRTQAAIWALANLPKPKTASAVLPARASSLLQLAS
jgi:two-component system, NarL family, nitrate/nitrite response regulator NarL